MAVGFTLTLTTVLMAIFVPLALTEKRSLILRIAYVFVGSLLALSFGLLFASFSGDRWDRPTGGRVTPAVVEVDLATQWAARGFGGCLVVLAAGELLRLILKRQSGADVLGPSILFLAGAVLIEPQWGIGLALAVGLLSVAAVAVWGKTLQPALSQTGAATSVSGTSGASDAPSASELGR